jgi:hypothetical protein
VSSLKALVLPADTPPSHASIKRQLLFFDSVLIVDPQSDSAIVNAGEIEETFPNGRYIRWGEIGSYSRSPGYVEAHRVLFAETARLQSQGKIRILKAAPRAVMDPQAGWVTSAAASREPDLVRAALPDYEPGTHAYYRKHGGWYNPAVVSDENYVSKHLWMRDTPHHEMPDIDIEWNQVGWVRIGRLLKSLRRADVESAVPLALDNVSQNIHLALGVRGSSRPLSAAALAEQAIALDAVEPAKLEDALIDMPWDEVGRLRKEILPHAAKLRQVLVSSVAAARQQQNGSLETYSKALAKVKEQHQRAVDDVRAAWQQLRFHTIEAGVSSAMGAGLSTLAPPGGWTTAILALAGLYASKAVPGSITNVHKALAASRSLKASPLFFFDRLPQSVATLARNRSDE